MSKCLPTYFGNFVSLLDDMQEHFANYYFYREITSNSCSIVGNEWRCSIIIQRNCKLVREASHQRSSFIAMLSWLPFILTIATTWAHTLPGIPESLNRYKFTTWTQWWSEYTTIERVYFLLCFRIRFEYKFLKITKLLKNIDNIRRYQPFFFPKRISNALLQAVIYPSLFDISWPW